METTESKIGTDLQKAEDILLNGGLVAIPTETVYGLAANGLDPEAVASIFEAKQRPSFDPLILHTHSISRAFELAIEVPDQARILAENFWPGPLTLVLKKGEIVPSIVSSGLETVGIRVPSHPLSLQLLENLPFPLAAPSANPFGYISPTSAQHVKDQLGDRVDYILDGGNSEVGIESTIVGFAEGKVQILRPGGISIEAIEEVIGEKVALQMSSSKPVAPGMLDSHYAPRTPLILGYLKTLLGEHSSKKVGYLSFSQRFDGHSGELLSENGNLKEAASNLFDKLRKLDSGNYELILAELVPNESLGVAINDRLKRASAKGL